MKKRGPSPPSHLSADARTWWRSVTTDYQLEPHHLHLLRLACEAMDRCEQARAILAVEGITVKDDRGNSRAHPAIGIEKDARTAVSRLVRELDLDTEAPAEGRRPPPLRSNSRR